MDAAVELVLVVWQPNLGLEQTGFRKKTAALRKRLVSVVKVSRRIVFAKVSKVNSNEITDKTNGFLFEPE